MNHNSKNSIFKKSPVITQFTSILGRQIWAILYRFFLAGNQDRCSIILFNGIIESLICKGVSINLRMMDLRIMWIHDFLAISRFQLMIVFLLISPWLLNGLKVWLWLIIYDCAIRFSVGQTWPSFWVVIYDGPDLWKYSRPVEQIDQESNRVVQIEKYLTYLNALFLWIFRNFDSNDLSTFGWNESKTRFVSEMGGRGHSSLRTCKTWASSLFLQVFRSFKSLRRL